VQEATGETVSLIYVDQGYTGENAAEAAQAQGVELCVVKLAEAKKGFVLLHKRWFVNRRTILPTFTPSSGRHPSRGHLGVRVPVG
jgi:hypothetical protein